MLLKMLLLLKKIVVLKKGNNCSLMDGTNTMISVNELVEGRVAAESFSHGDVSIKPGDIITKYVSKAMGRGLELHRLKLEIFLLVGKRGVCRKCYGLDLCNC